MDENKIDAYEDVLNQVKEVFQGLNDPSVVNISCDSGIYGIDIQHLGIVRDGKQIAVLKLNLPD